MAVYTSAGVCVGFCKPDCGNGNMFRLKAFGWPTKVFQKFLLNMCACVRVCVNKCHNEYGLIDFMAFGCYCCCCDCVLITFVVNFDLWPFYDNLNYFFLFCLVAFPVSGPLSCRVFCRFKVIFALHIS